MDHYTMFVCFNGRLSFKEGGEYPLGWDLAHILRPNRPHYHPEVGAQLPNSLGELNPYSLHHKILSDIARNSADS